MTLIIKFFLIMLVGFGLSRTERPIHSLESAIAGNAGINDWYLIMRYTIGLGMSDLVLVFLALMNEKLKPHAELIGLLALFRAVSIGSGVSLGFLWNSWKDLENLTE